MEAGDGVIAWRLLHENYILPGVAIEQPVPNAPDLRLFYSPADMKLGLLLRVGAGVHWSGGARLQNVSSRRIVVGGQHHIEVSTAVEALFRPIYALIADIAARISDGENDGLKALELGLADFETLLARAAQLSRERVLGLYGELWVLERILEAGAATVASWIGHQRQSHDFRIGRSELEVKATLANSREHTIHGINQLAPSPAHALHLISLRLSTGSSSEGRSLNGLISDLRRRLAASTVNLKAFETALRACAYDESDPEGAVSYQLAAPATSVLIGTNFPVISQDWLVGVLGAAPASRIRNASFTLDCEGLGQPFDAGALK